jgi:hypothetical protein
VLVLIVVVVVLPIVLVRLGSSRMGTRGVGEPPEGGGGAPNGSHGGNQ